MIYFGPNSFWVLFSSSPHWNKKEGKNGFPRRQISCQNYVSKNVSQNVSMCIRAFTLVVFPTVCIHYSGCDRAVLLGSILDFSFSTCSVKIAPMLMWSASTSYVECGIDLSFFSFIFLLTTCRNVLCVATCVVFKNLESNDSAYDKLVSQYRIGQVRGFWPVHVILALIERTSILTLISSKNAH